MRYTGKRDIKKHPQRDLIGSTHTRSSNILLLPIFPRSNRRFCMLAVEHQNSQTNCAMLVITTLLVLMYRRRLLNSSVKEERKDSSKENRLQNLKLWMLPRWNSRIKNSMLLLINACWMRCYVQMTP